MLYITASYDFTSRGRETLDLAPAKNERREREREGGVSFHTQSATCVSFLRDDNGDDEGDGEERSREREEG